MASDNGTGTFEPEVEEAQGSGLEAGLRDGGWRFKGRSSRPLVGDWRLLVEAEGSRFEAGGPGLKAGGAGSEARGTRLQA